MDLDHEREMERLKQEALDKKARMTAEQLMAVAAGENLDSQAAVKFAESKPGRTSLITLLEKAKDGIEGKTGTAIHL